jgi:putative nucleotidyltransferase with HDIG domain
MALLVFALFMFTFRNDIYNENRNIVLLLLLITIMVSFTTFVMNINVSYIMAVPICLVPIIVRTFYDTRLALFVHILTIIILGFLVPNSFEFLFMQLITGIITIISVVHLHHRSQFFFSSLMILLSYSVIYIGMTLMQEGSFEQLSRANFLMFGISALLTLFSYPLIYLFEKIFGMVTDVSLIELSDTNSKLLRELAIKSPGTFQHSLIVSNIAEEAARAIGANSLLARTGALYHDIGKMDMPMYYIENQSGGINPHDDLSFEESARIITGHVIRGIEKARQYKLPETIIDFIRTHHGTRYTQYFYQKFKNESGDVPFDESPFRYRGPVPHSKETSILMMADSIEAASRSLKAPTEPEVSELVERLVDYQVEQKQFRNSSLTLREISTIKKIIKKKLLSIYHIRVEYPTLH